MDADAAAGRYCPGLPVVLFGRYAAGLLGRSSVGPSMPETASATSFVFSRPLALVAAAAGIVLAATLALWAHYGTAVFYETILAGIALCF